MGYSPYLQISYRAKVAPRLGQQSIEHDDCRAGSRTDVGEAALGGAYRDVAATAWDKPVRFLSSAGLTVLRFINTGTKSFLGRNDKIKLGDIT